MTERPPTDAELAAARSRAESLWCYQTNDEIWTALFSEGENVAAELLEYIAADRTFTVGDLTHTQCLARITRRYPYLKV